MLANTRDIAVVVTIILMPHIAAQQRSVDDFFRDFSAEWVRGNPNQATATRYFTGGEQDRLEQQLTPETDEWRFGRVRLAQRGLQELARFDRGRMTEDQRLSADLMQWQLQMMTEGERFLDFEFPLEQFGGANVDLVNALTVVHPARTEKDAANYVARLAQVDERMTEATAEAERRARLGILPPRFILTATIEQMRLFIAPPPAQNPYVTTLVEKMSSIPSLPAERRQQLGAQASRLVEMEVYPAWRKALAALEAQLPRATDDAGLWRFPRGAEVYAHRLKLFTSTSLTADEIHELGLREVRRIETEMDAILRRLGFTEGTIKDRVAKLKETLGYPITEEGRTRIMADIEGIIRDAERRSDVLFDRRPKAPVVAQPYPRFREANAAASYTAPPLDGSRPGIFQMPLRPDQMTKFALRTLVYHETVPGHHFHVALAVENPQLPRFRQIRAFGGISAITEGWALYAERLAAESGWYEGDLEGLLGQLDDELFRARRLVVDTGLHAKRWTRQQAIDYGIDPSEVERYVVNPGQACAYKIGQLKILELRDKAQKALGPKFSMKAFHNVVLGVGTLPLTILEQQVDRYIRGQTP
jgi:uncharacterized protein (DUF885 family)